MPSDSEMQGDPGAPAGPVEAQVKWYNSRKGFGFVLGPDGQDVFFHASALTEAGIEPPETGDTLVCEIGSDRQGRRLVTRIVERRLGEGGGVGPRPFRDGGGNSGGGYQDRPPRRDFGGGGYQDRPPRQDFGGGGYQDRPPRRDFGAPSGGFGAPGGGYQDRPPRRDFGAPSGGFGGGFGAPRPSRDFGAPAGGGYQGGGYQGGGNQGGGYQDRPPRRDFVERDAGGPTYDVSGTVKWFDQVRGFGFVTPEDGGQDVFLHSSVLQRAGRGDVQQGEKLSLEVRDGQRGRQAVTLK